MATHSRILAWRIPWAVQSVGSYRVGHDRVANTLHLPTPQSVMFKALSDEGDLRMQHSFL